MHLFKQHAVKDSENENLFMSYDRGPDRRHLLEGAA